MAPKAATTAPKRRSSTSAAAKSTKPSLTRSFSSTKAGQAGSNTGKKGSSTSTGKAQSASAVKESGEEEDDDREEADALNRAYPRLLKQSKKEMGPPIHAEDWDNLQIILRVFDCSPEYGPCSNQPRLERYERAVALGLEPPKEIGEILRSSLAKKRPDIAQSAFTV